MPTIDVNYQDLFALMGRNVPLDELQSEGILYAKGEIDEVEGEMLKIDIKDTNRPDLWSAEGIARELQGRYGAKTGCPKYVTKPSGLVVNVDSRLKSIRPLTVCAVVRDINITQDVLMQMIQLQEKVSMTFGRNRKEVAIGVYDYRKIKGPIRFTSVKPDGIRFVPLESERPMTPAQILRSHPKGKEYGHLLSGKKEYPVFIDSAGEVLSMPPIINSDHTGKVTTATRDVFIECSGFDFRFLIPALNVIVAALSDRGGKVETVKVVYKEGAKVTPDLKPKKARLDVGYANSISGLDLKASDIVKLLEKARYDAKASGNSIEVLYPPYRQDMMHQRDVVEDMIISYGYNRIKPLAPRLATIGSEAGIEKFSDSVAQVMVGMGMQEVLSYVLTNRNDIFRRMNLPEGKVVQIENFSSSNWSVFRSWLLPSLLEFLSENKHNEYPQKVFEIGDVVMVDPKAETRSRDVRKLAACISDHTAGYEEMAGAFHSLMHSLGLEYSLKPANHPSFIPGRAAFVYVSGKQAGIVGEMHPGVLNAWGIENPVVCMELDLSAIRTISTS